MFCTLLDILMKKSKNWKGKSNDYCQTCLDLASKMDHFENELGLSLEEIVLKTITVAWLCSRPLEVMGARNTEGRMGCVRETREGRRSFCPRGPWKSFQLAFWECGYFRLVERLPRETSSRVRQRNCQSKKTGDRLFNK